MQTDTDNPALVYRDSLSRGIYWADHHSLATIAELLDGEGTDPWTFSWWELEYRHIARARRELVERYAPGTVNKMLTVLRGVLKTCWRLGLGESSGSRPRLSRRLLTQVKPVDAVTRVEAIDAARDMEYPAASSALFRRRAPRGAAATGGVTVPAAHLRDLGRA